MGNTHILLQEKSASILGRALLCVALIQADKVVS